MDYVINALGLPFNGDTIKSSSLGGSESAAYYLARELAARGHRVTAFTMSNEEGVFDGVTYCHAGNVTNENPMGERFEFYARNTPHDVLIVQRSPMAFQGKYAAKLTIWQTHDLALHHTSGLVMNMAWNINAVTTVSQWHKDQLLAVYPFAKGVVHVVPNGVDPDLYSGPLDPTMVLANPTGGLRLLYQSRPERGLAHLVRPGGIMDRLRGIATLYVCGYENTTEQMASFYAQLESWGKALPNIVHLGALTKPNLAQLQRNCDVLCYPTEFDEVSCITVMEAMHAHLPVITSDCAALPETCKDAGVELIPLRDNMADENLFVAWLKMAHADLNDELREGASILGKMKLAQATAARTRTWAKATDALEFVVADCLDAKSPTTIARHALKNSDLTLTKMALAVAPDNAITRKLKEELSLFDFLDDDAAYKAHYDKHCGDYYQRVPREQRFKEPDGSRWIAVRMMVAQAIESAGRPLRILDYGCAHGHYTISLAKMFPDSSFYGVDINATAIQEAIEWAGADIVHNVEFTRADSVRDLTGQYDLVLLCEVLEHVKEPQLLLYDACERLTEGGKIITTTPYGPWEWGGHDSYKLAREHNHHFERTDLVELFVGMELNVVCAPAGVSPGGTPVGSWVCMATPGKNPAFGEVNFQRKYRETVPEQTVSACLIVKDGANSLRKALDSLVPWVAEVIIGIDPASTDSTHDVIAAFAAANPWLPVTQFIGERAIEVGFDVARNTVVDRACGDWILWMDADEELMGGEYVTKLLHENMHDAYCTGQIHFSVDPPQVLTIDYPSRLYRNNRGIRFYGRVHEHPETAPGEAIPTATLRGDVKFAHNGYVTEEVRRARYFRNLPLLMRDVNEHPDRILNKFLLIRDLAQGIGFELQLNGGRPDMGHRGRAQQIVDLWRELLKNEKPVSRMLIDSLPYYTIAAEIIGGWFNADVTFNVNKLSLDTKQRVQGKFLTAADLNTLVTRLSKEATQHYDSVYF